MDLRLFVIGLTFLLLVVALVFFVAVLRSSRRARSRSAIEARASGDAIAADANTRPLGEILREPIRTGEWPPRDDAQPAAQPANHHEPSVSVPTAAVAPVPAPVAPAPPLVERPPVTVRTVEPPAAVAPAPTPTPAVPAEPPSAIVASASEPPAPSLAVSVPEPIEEPVLPPPAVIAPVAVPAAEDSTPEPQVRMHTEGEQHYQLVAPVELRIQGMRKRIGVRAGSTTHDEFQRAAQILLAELRRSRDSQA